MPKEGEETINTSGQDLGGGTPSGPHISPDGLISTLDNLPPSDADIDPEKAKIIEGQTEEEKAKAEEEAKVKEAEEETAKAKEEEEHKAKEKEEADRYDKLPRFIELNERTKAAEARAQRAEAELTTVRAQPTKEEKPTYKDISQMTKEEVIEWRDDDPVGFYSNLASQIDGEVGKRVNQNLNTRNTETNIAQTFQEYSDKNSDFMSMWNSGEISRYMQAHPGHNAISAHMDLTAEKRSSDAKAETDKAIAEAVKKKEEEVVKNFKTKGVHPRVLGGGPATGGRVVDTGISPELKEPEKFGGLINVLAERSRKREQQATD